MSDLEEQARESAASANEAQDLADDLAIVAELDADEAAGIKTERISWETVEAELHETA